MTVALDSGGSAFVTDETGGTLIVVGELDASGAALLLTTLVGGDETADRRVDLAGVTFADSGALRTFIQARRLLAEQGRRLVLFNRSEPVTRLFDVTDLSDMFDE